MVGMATVRCEFHIHHSSNPLQTSVVLVCRRVRHLVGGRYVELANSYCSTLDGRLMVGMATEQCVFHIHHSLHQHQTFVCRLAEMT